MKTPYKLEGQKLTLVYILPFYFSRTIKHSQEA